MKHSLSFLGCSVEQLPVPGQYGNDGVEAALFNLRHLEDSAWKQNWQNISLAAHLYGAENVTFHFPMNECDFVADAGIRDRLKEGYQRAGQLGLAGMVVHSNRIRVAQEWEKFDVHAEQSKVFHTLTEAKQKGATPNTWLGLENMPLVGNYQYETDPLFVGACDFTDLPTDIGIVWDVCHALGSLQYLSALQQAALPSNIFARLIDPECFDLSVIRDRIVHWHFAGSTGLNNPETGQTCTEGVLPWEADQPIEAFEDAIDTIYATQSQARIINFEVQELDYSQRHRGPAIIEWAKRASTQAQSSVNSRAYPPSEV